MRNRILLCALSREKAPLREERAHIKRCAAVALDRFGWPCACKVQAFYTDDAGIAAINLEQRGINAPTDVLSFPFFEPRENPVPDPDTGLVYLGDIVISLERAREQAVEYGHSKTRELGYLVVHGVLHLLGYDHEKPKDAERMRRAEEEVLKSIGLER